MSANGRGSPSSVFVDAGGTRVHCLDWRSDQPPLMIVHGNTHAGGVYAPLAERLAPGFRVVTVDLRGHGLSDKSDDYAWTAMRDDLVAVIDQLGLDDLIIAAHSRGGGVSILAAAARRERMRGLLVFEPTLPPRFVDPSLPVAVERERAVQRVAKTADRRFEFPSRDAAYEHYKGRGAFRNWRGAYLRAFVQHCLVDAASGQGCQLASPPEVEGQLVRSRLGLVPWTTIVPCDLPVLALFGEHSGRIVPDSDPLSGIKRIFPNTAMQVLPGCSHSAPMERPDLYEAAIVSFATGRARRGG